MSYTLSQVCGFRGQWIMYIVRRSKYFRAQCLIQVTGVPPRCGEGNKNVWIRFRWYSLLRAPSPHWQPIQINLYSRMWRGWGGAVHWWISPNQYLYTCKLKCFKYFGFDDNLWKSLIIVTCDNYGCVGNRFLSIAVDTHSLTGVHL